MKDDFNLIIHKLPRDIDYIKIYPIADLHLGAKECNEIAFQKLIDDVVRDERAYIVMCGDMLNMGLKNSKTNVYEELYRPREQKERLYEYLLPIKDRILGAISGNHEYRMNKEVDSNPLYDVMCRLGIEDNYRENIAFMKVSLGERTATRQISYSIVLHHGASKNKKDRFSYAIDNMDILITGHTHKPEIDTPIKYVIDMKNNSVTKKEITSVVCNSLLQYGGYAVRGAYLPQGSDRTQQIILDGTKKAISFLLK